MKKDEKNNMDESLEEYDEENYTSELDDLPEYERELILAKRHEEYMKKKHRRMLLKNLHIDQKSKGNIHDDTNKSVDTSNQKKKGKLNNKKLKLKKKLSESDEGEEKEEKEENDDDQYDNIYQSDEEQKKDNKKKKSQSKKIKGDNESYNIDSISYVKYKKGKIKILEDDDEKNHEDEKKKNHITDDVSVTDHSYTDSSYKNKKKSKYKKDDTYKKDKTNKKDETDVSIKTKKHREDYSDDYHSTSSYENEKSSDVHYNKKEKKLHLKVISEESHLDNNKNKTGKSLNKILNENKKKKKDIHIIDSGVDEKKDVITNIFEKNEKINKDKELDAPQTPERLVHLYKEEKKIKMDIYNYMTYDIITYFQLKKTFLLDMCEHVHFSYHVIGHMIKIIDTSKLNKVTDEDIQNTNNKKKIDIENENKKKIFFITNVIKSEPYFSTDRNTNIKFEVAHLENLAHSKFFKKIKNIMYQNKKISMDELKSNEYYETYICDMNNISDQKFNIDEYNHIKLFSIDLEILKMFHLFIKEKNEDLKNFRYTEKQLQDLFEKKKQKSFYEIYTNNKSIDNLPITRITVQREICSIQREIDKLNFDKKKTNTNDTYTLSKLNNQISELTKKITILRGNLDKARKNHAAMKSNEHFAQEKNVIKEKSKTNIKSALKDDITNKFLGVDEMDISYFSKQIYDEKTKFNNMLSSKFINLPLDVHHKVVHHFLLGTIQNNDAVFYDDPSHKIKKELDAEVDKLLGLHVNRHITLFDDIKKNYE
ncbi:conserved Plasmodium protein, unknown function [Plasmodium sp. gorilla clade G2]|uniref:conserved Plasmodium protein, unknown function n=1 Tax=Plasmodium sp. gorilla clade G2 TaxID=880535 RepID=UPI000D20C8D4|nr:conserved Plasmodium protein, unknown function [Plasmodium sp. gorilla clade G2]SOV16904.1 conserved Plasmodium protein, unknown function [Plasmodium sp. gorilla clade G2]